MIATPDVFPNRNPCRGFPLDCFLGLTDRSSLHYFGSRAQCIHDSDRVQKRTLNDGTFDLLNPEDRLLLTHVPRVQRAPEFAAVTPHRLTSLRILAIWGLTNGSDAVMIDCVHGVTHLVVALTCAGRVGRSGSLECLANGLAGNAVLSLVDGRRAEIPSSTRYGGISRSNCGQGPRIGGLAPYKSE
jgi:hypothetical protein